MNPVFRFLLLAFAWLCFALGIVGVFIPLLPTTPLILLATFICARYSPRCHSFIVNSKVYRSYVLPFKEAGGMTGKAKARMLAISYTVLFISAVLVQRPMVWIDPYLRRYLPALPGMHPHPHRRHPGSGRTQGSRGGFPNPLTPRNCCKRLVAFSKGKENIQGQSVLCGRTDMRDAGAGCPAGNRRGARGRLSVIQPELKGGLHPAFGGGAFADAEAVAKVYHISASTLVCCSCQGTGMMA